MPPPDDLIAPEGRPAEGSRVVVAFSGGLDSTVLLHLLHARGAYDLCALHVHHGLQGVADAWAIHCRDVCALLEVPVTVVRVHVREDGQGPEAAAREARYAAFRDALQPGDALATAHHRDDQAETVLLGLLRGGGLRGLGAMAVRRDFPPGSLWRPLLDTPRDRLVAYARAQGLVWLDDPHNTSDRFARSFLRAEIMPRLVGRWPGAGASLARAATLGREAAALLDVLADGDLSRILGDRAVATLPIDALLGLDAPRRRNLVRRWLGVQALPAPYFDTLHRLDAEVLAARPDAEPVLGWPGGEMRRYRGALHAMVPLPPAPDDVAIAWSGEGGLELPKGCGRLEGEGVGGCVVRLPPPVVKFRLAGDTHTRTLKNLYQERGVPPWVRLRTPALERDGRVEWIGGIGWADAAMRDGVRVGWIRDAEGG